MICQNLDQCAALQMGGADKFGFDHETQTRDSHLRQEIPATSAYPLRGADRATCPVGAFKVERITRLQGLVTQERQAAQIVGGLGHTVRISKRRTSHGTVAQCRDFARNQR